MSQPTTWNPESYARDARFVSDLGEPLLQILDPKPGELILDLGCGDGTLGEKIAARSNLVGVDSSMPFLKSTRGRDLTVVQMDGQQLALKRCFDAVFSNAALHWMKRPEKVLEGIANCLKPHGTIRRRIRRPRQCRNHTRGSACRTAQALHRSVAIRSVVLSGSRRI
jgi:trans-aconitate methyltransferase